MTHILFMLGIMIIIAAATGTIVVKGKGKSDQFDERQIIGRGKATAAGFYSLMLLLLGYIICRNTLDLSILSPELGISLCIVIAVAVFGVVGVFKDAYIGFNGNEKAKKVSMVVLGGANIVLGATDFLDGSFLKNGELGISILNLAIGVMALLIGVCISIRGAQQKKEAAAEESDD